jgi:hypothetical protein
MMYQKRTGGEAMPVCPNCGKEVKEGAVFCPFCGTKLAKSKAQPTTAIKRRTSITVCAILLFVCCLIHILNMYNLIVVWEELVGSSIELFFSVLALVAGCFLWKSKEIGGIIGIEYAILTTLYAVFIGYSDMLGIEYNLLILGIFLDVPLCIAIVTLIVVNWKHLKHPKGSVVRICAILAALSAGLGVWSLQLQLDWPWTVVAFAVAVWSLILCLRAVRKERT